MTTPSTDKRLDAWRLLILRRNSDEIMLRTEGARFTLPQMTIPAGERIAANINQAVERELGLSVVSLYEIFSELPGRRGRVFYHAAVLARPCERVPVSTYWSSVRSLSADLFALPDDFAAIAALRSRLDAGKKGGTAEPFLPPHWFVEVSAWIKRSLDPHALRLRGPFEQFNASSTFSLIRFETDGRAVWFKAVGEPNTREFLVTLTLARACPEYLPRILAENGDWNAWLAAEASGPCLSSSRDTELWEKTAASLAHLQLLTLPRLAELSSSGARDLRAVRLVSRVAPFFDFLAELARKSDLEAGEAVADLHWRELTRGVEEALRDLDRLALPDTVGHMDLHPQNIFCSEQNSVFLDWAEAFVGCPFFSFEYLLQHFRRSFPSDESHLARLRLAYLRRWRYLLSESDLQRALTLVPLVALFAYASTLREGLGANHSSTIPQQIYLLRLTQKMSRMMRQATGVCA